MSPEPRSTLALRRPTARRRAWYTVFLAAAAVGALGCAATPTARLPPADHAPAPYLIKTGDTLDIRFYKTPELNLEVPVRSDGKISLELVGDIQAAGLQPEQLAGALRERYASELTDPRVSVIIRKFGGGVFVGGEVKNPSRIPFRSGMTALQAIHQAGGFLDTARPSHVVLIRREGDHYQGYLLPLDRVETGEEISADVGLQPWDIVHVPKSAIANVDLFVDQYIHKMLPVTPAIPLF